MSLLEIDKTRQQSWRLTQLFPEVWAEDNPPGLARHQAPNIIELKPGATPVRKHQYPIPIEAQIGILPHINRLQQAGILVECQSAWNTPILLVKKEDKTMGLYRSQVGQSGHCNSAPDCPKPLYLA